MIRLSLVCTLLAGCLAQGPDPIPTEEASRDTVTTLGSLAGVAFRREHVAGDVYHYEARIPVGSGPNAALRVHRVVRELAPFVPRPAAHAAMLLHGDFATFVTNFAPTLGAPASPAPGLAPYLAADDVDVWGVDRRWTLPGAAGDLSDFATMGLAQDLSDLRAALALARTVRAVDSGSAGPLALVGFSHGAEIAYVYAATDAARPASQRSIGALAALDFFGAYGAADADLQAQACANADAEYAAVAGGTTDSPNDFLISTGALAQAAPGDPSPLVPGYTNEHVMLLVMGQTYLIAPITPLYHLLAPVLDADGNPTALHLTTDRVADAWLAAAPPHEALLEAADLDAQLCGTAPPVAAPLSQIRVPLYYQGAAGGVGARGLAATTQVSSTDVTTRVWTLGGDAAADVGHGDLLYAPAARGAAWAPLAAWLGHH